MSQLPYNQEIGSICIRREVDYVIASRKKNIARHPQIIRSRIVTRPRLRDQCIRNRSTNTTFQINLAL